MAREMMQEGTLAAALGSACGTYHVAGPPPPGPGVGVKEKFGKKIKCQVILLEGEIKTFELEVSGMDCKMIKRHIIFTVCFMENMYIVSFIWNICVDKKLKIYLLHSEKTGFRIHG